MARKKNRKDKPNWTYYSRASEPFSMPSDGLLTAPEMLLLTNGAQLLYIRIITWKQTKQQKQSLYKAMKEYESELMEKRPDSDLQMIANDPDSPYFVLTESQMKRYGSPTKSIRRNLKELQESGFIEVYKEKPKSVTIYRLSGEWKIRKFNGQNDSSSTVKMTVD